MLWFKYTIKIHNTPLLFIIRAPLIKFKASFYQSNTIHHMSNNLKKFEDKIYHFFLLLTLKQ